MSFFFSFLVENFYFYTRSFRIFCNHRPLTSSHTEYVIEPSSRASLLILAAPKIINSILISDILIKIHSFATPPFPMEAELHLNRQCYYSTLNLLWVDIAFSHPHTQPLKPTGADTELSNINFLHVFKIICGTYIYFYLHIDICIKILSRRKYNTTL